MEGIVGGGGGGGGGIKRNNTFCIGLTYYQDEYEFSIGFFLVSFFTCRFKQKSTLISFRTVYSLVSI